MANTVYIEAICPECGQKFRYVRCGYRPITCKRKECVFAHAHPKIKNARRPWGDSLRGSYFRGGG